MKISEKNVANWNTFTPRAILCVTHFRKNSLQLVAAAPPMSHCYTYAHRRRFHQCKGEVIRQEPLTNDQKVARLFSSCQHMCMKSCLSCSAEFGIKFEPYTCLSCEKKFCKAHLVPIQNLNIHRSLMQSWKGGDGLCFTCILVVWQCDDESLSQPRGLFGRLKHIAGSTVESAARLTGIQKDPRTLLSIDAASFTEFSSTRAFAVLRHQRVLSNDEIMQDLANWARLFAITQGRSTERELCLNDLFHVVDWLRTRPPFPKFLLGMNWSTLERSPQYMALASDVLHITRGTFALMSGGTTEVAYRVTDRAIEHFTGKSSFEFAYDKVKTTLGVNVNLRSFILYWFVGQIILQLLARREESAAGKVSGERK